MSKITSSIQELCGFLFVFFLSRHKKPFFSPSVHQSVSRLASWSVSASQILFKVFWPAQWPPIYAFWDSPSFLFLVADTRLYTLPCRSVGKSQLNSERFSHYCSCPTVRDWIAVYLALLCNKIEGNKAGYMANKQSLVGGQGQGKKYELAGDVFW